MRMIFGLVLVFGLALAGAAVYMAQNYISKTQVALDRERQIRAKTGPLVEVYVVNKAKNYGEVLTKEDVQLIYWPENTLPETIFREEEVLFPNGGKEPRYVLRQMEQYDPVMAIKVTEPGQPAGLTGQLAKGSRAFAIRVDVASGVSGFVQPGDHVDVYWTGGVSGADGGSSDVTRLIESGVRVIAVDQTAAGGSGNAVVARTVTVAVSPEEVARLAQAQSTGSLALSLVGTGDETVNAKIEVNQQGLLGIEATIEVAAPEEAKVCVIRTRKGSDMVEMPIPCTN